jgi:hypothetical protein
MLINGLSYAERSISKALLDYQHSGPAKVVLLSCIEATLPSDSFFQARIQANKGVFRKLTEKARLVDR